MTEDVSPRPPRRADGAPQRGGTGGAHRASAEDPTRGARTGAPDDRRTSVIPPVREGTPAHLRDPIDVVKRALDGTPPKQPPPPPPPPPPGGGGPTGEGPSGPAPTPGQQINWKWVRRGLYAAMAVLIVLPILTFGMAYMIVDVPKPGDIRTAQVSTILASDGSELSKIVPPEGNRIDVDIDQIPVHVRDAVMAAEDRDFYSNPGFSFTGFMRAAKNNIFGGDLQGGSTITQQYVKNALVGDARSGVGGLIRKAKELVISTKMSGEWSKDQVLQSYLNIIYFGRGAYGVAAASQAYFNKPVEQLDVAEGALLAALIQLPSVLDPAVDPDASAARWNWVLDGMVEIGALSPADRAAQVFPPTVPRDQASMQNQTTGPNGLIERQVINELLEIFNINEQTLNTEGLQITTTIDPPAQSAAVDAVENYLDGQDPDMRAAVVSIDPRTGGIRAYYGGSDASGFDFAQAGLPTGSAFKVFALIAALEQGMGLGFQVDSSPVDVNGIKITNVEGGGCGTCNIAEALKKSLNTSYYRLMLKLDNGPQDVADAAHQAGIADSFPGVEHTLSEDGKGGPPNNGIVLGQYQSRVLDMASAYATIAASGVYHRPHFVQKVVNAEGDVLFDASQEDNAGEQRIDKAVADNVTAAMQPIAGYSNGHNLAGGRPSAAKTGTNQLGDTGANRDAWMVGFTPSLSTAVWVGTTDGTRPLVNEWGGPVYGSGLPSDIWKATMDGALEGTDIESFPKPEEIGGYAGVPQAPPPPPPPPSPTDVPPPPSETVIQPTLEIAPGITIPWGPPTTVPVGPPPPNGPPPGPEGVPGAPPAPAPAPEMAPPGPGLPPPPGPPPPP
ncbi:penicillin-binding protein 1A [Mycolicibacterium cyprinidarum]|uniref:Penicillin-binding protein 1A n=1 Tax=Mycolicibacterium cyprinidarum TaxID=2860311 RepID=A0ABQ4VC65_9MYCO|nr:penicillin-binding protein 1A [Mycolicibacterium sp. NGTWS1803]GJF13443.1 penicillin-binding protein 1A [Mycolicibacterium sp. NGTWSNA01]GJF15949.1 penicillin-binding protein 1A [Mycolicibacterium sp. NGTWS0302]